MNSVARLVSDCFKGLFYRRSKASEDGASHASQVDQTDGQGANGRSVARPATSVQDHSDTTWGCLEAFLLLFRPPKLPVNEKFSSPVLSGGSKIENSNGNTVPQQNLEKRDSTHSPTPSEGDHGFPSRRDTVEQRNQTAPLDMQLEAVPSQAVREAQRAAARVVDIQPNGMRRTGSVEMMNDENIHPRAGVVSQNIHSEADSHDSPADQDEGVSYAQPPPMLEEDNLGHNGVPDIQHSIHSGETLNYTAQTNSQRQPRKKSAHPESFTNGGKQPRKKREVEEGDPPPSESSTMIREKQPRKKPEVQGNDEQPSTSRKPGKNVEESAGG